MTVEDLIAILETYPDDLEVQITGAYASVTNVIFGLSSCGDHSVQINTDLMSG